MEHLRALRAWLTPERSRIVGPLMIVLGFALYLLGLRLEGKL